jgi:hypothetical protein
MPDLAPFSLPGRFWRGNLHTHSTLSDGAREPDQVIEAYKGAGYDFMMLSDHFPRALLLAHRRHPQAALQQLHHAHRRGTPCPHDASRRAVAHRGRGTAARLRPGRGRRDRRGLARRAADSGAFVGIAHPAWSQLTIEDGRAIEAAHAVEIYNHGCAVECDRGDGWYLMDQLLNDGRRLTAFATDDAHFTNGEHDAFGGWVEVRAESLEPETILAALKAGHYYSTQGPRIHELAISGDELTVVCSPVDTISVMGGTSRTASQVGHAITRATIDLGKLARSWLPEQAGSPWLRVALIDAGGKRAWTNPIWLEDLAS